MNTKYTEIDGTVHSDKIDGKYVDRVVRRSMVGCDKHYRSQVRDGKLCVWNCWADFNKWPDMYNVEAHPTNEQCEMCEQIAIDEAKKDARMPEVRAAMLDSKFAYTRFREWCGVGIVYIYHLEPGAPKGVTLATSIDEVRYNKIIDTLRQEGVALHGGHSPLSPTEML